MTDIAQVCIVKLSIVVLLAKPSSMVHALLYSVLGSALRQLRPNQLQGEGSPKVAKLTLFSKLR